VLRRHIVCDRVVFFSLARLYYVTNITERVSAMVVPKQVADNEQLSVSVDIVPVNTNGSHSTKFFVCG